MAAMLAGRLAKALNWDWQGGEICPESIASSSAFLLATETFLGRKAKWVNWVLLMLVYVVLQVFRMAVRNLTPDKLLVFLSVLVKVESFKNLFLRLLIPPFSIFFLSFDIILPLWNCILYTECPGLSVVGPFMVCTVQVGQVSVPALNPL